MSVFGAKKTEEPSRPVSPETPKASGQPSSLIGRTLFVKGEVISEDDVIIDGHVDGKIIVKNRLVIGKNALIKSEIEANMAVIEGKVEGNVKCKKRVEIVPGGTLIGDITSPTVVIAEGGFFEGNIDMRGRNEKSSSFSAEKGGGSSSGAAEKESQTAKNLKK